jgi:hypothetical protein
VTEGSLGSTGRLSRAVPTLPWLCDRHRHMCGRVCCEWIMDHRQGGSAVAGDLAGCQAVWQGRQGGGVPVSPPRQERGMDPIYTRGYRWVIAGEEEARSGVHRPHSRSPKRGAELGRPLHRLRCVNRARIHDLPRGSSARAIELPLNRDAAPAPAALLV